MQNWKTLAKEQLYQHEDGKWLTVENHSIELPDGTTIDNWAWLDTPSYVIITAVTDADKFLCFRQTKYAIEGTTLAPPGGYIELGEDPLLAAKRELLEETGYTATEWTNLGSYAVDGNRGAGTAHLYLAQNATWQQPIDADDLEEQKLLYLSQQEVIDALLTGEFKALPWATGIALALLKM